MIAPEKPSGVELGYARLAKARGEGERVAATASLILEIFDEFYAKFREYSQRAKQAFERMDARDSVNVSTERLGLYTRYIAEHGPRIRAAFEALSVESSLGFPRSPFCRDDRRSV